MGPDYYRTLGDATASRSGHHAVAVPGTVAGLLWALLHYGTPDRSTLLAPAIRASERGFPHPQWCRDWSSARCPIETPRPEFRR